MNYTKELLKLAQENPNLPIVPLVWYEVCCENCGHWLGNFQECRVDEYLCWNERYYLKSDIEDLISDYYELDDTDYTMLDIEEHITGIFQDEWTKAIIVWVGLPEIER